MQNEKDILIEKRNIKIKIPIKSNDIFGHAYKSNNGYFLKLFIYKKEDGSYYIVPKKYKNSFIMLFIYIKRTKDKNMFNIYMYESKNKRGISKT